MSTGTEAPPYRVTGPAALSGSPGRFLHLTVMLAVTDWKLRFYGSALGYLWSLLRPLLLFGMLLFVFSQIVRIGGDVKDYPVVLLIGVVLFSYFSEVTGDAVESVLDREQLVRKVSFPRMVVPLSVTLAGSFSLVLNLAAASVLVLAVGVEPRLSWLLLPIPLVCLVVLATGVAMLLSALYVPFRDVRPIWDVVTQALFYATPIFYPVEFLIGQSELLTKIVMASPLAVIVVETRRLVLGPESTGAAEAVGSDAFLLIPLAILVAIAVAGFVVFNRMAPRAAEQL
jgi:ABC-2 type transport system permease protein